MYEKNIFFFFAFLQEIDGKALKLLDTDKMTRYMEIKLGPALKIADLVKRFKVRKHANNF